MKKLIVLLFFFSSITGKADLWTQKMNYPTTTSWGIFFSIEGKGYIGAGQAFVSHKDFWQYEPASNTWTQKADYGGGLMWGGSSFAIGTKGYAGLGYDTAFMPRQDFWEYDTFTNIWTQKANFTGSGRVDPLFFSVNGMGYAGMGYDSIMTLHNDLWQYDPATDVWTQKGIPPIALKCEAPNNFVIDGIAYIVGGAHTLNMLNTVWKYDPIADTWAQKNNFPFVARCLGVAFSLCRKGYFGTGTDGNGITYLNDLWEYDPLTDAWTQKTSLPGAGRQASAYFTIGDKAYVGTGVNHTTIFSDFYEYSPDILCITGFNTIVNRSVGIEVVPNPVSEYIIIESAHLPDLLNSTVKITDLKGKVILEKKYINPGIEIKINTKEWLRGIYLIQITSPRTNWSGKIAVM